MFVPGFDPNSMSDEELFEKQAEISRRLTWAYRSGGGGVEQMMVMAEAIESVRRDRAFVANYNMMEAGVPDTFESDPDLRADQKGKSTASKDVKKPLLAARPRPFSPKTKNEEILVPTTQPVAPPLLKPEKQQD